MAPYGRELSRASETEGECVDSIIRVLPETEIPSVLVLCPAPGYSPMAKIPTLCAIKSRHSRVYHPQLVAVYHQCEALYIIKPQEDAR